MLAKASEKFGFSSKIQKGLSCLSKIVPKFSSHLNLLKAFGNISTKPSTNFFNGKFYMP